MMKLLVSDLDGTLYPRKEVANKNQFEDNIKAVREWVKNGNKFVAASAREKRHHQQLVKELGFNLNYIGSNGAEIVYEEGEEAIKDIPLKVFIDVARFLEAKNINAAAGVNCDGKRLWSSRDRFPFNCDDNIRSSWRDEIIVPDLDLLDPEKRIISVHVVVPPKNRDEVEAMIAAMKMNVTVTTSDVDLINIEPYGCSKGAAVLQVAKRFGIAVEDIVTVGDSENDISMLKITDNSYCIDHAEPRVRWQAKNVVASVAEVVQKEMGKQTVG